MAAEGRQATITVAKGYSGDGHTITVESGYEFATVLFESDKAEYDRERNVITLSEAVTERLDLAVTATANCAAASARNCAPLALTVSAAFIPLEPYVQTPLIATQDDNFRAHLLNVGGRTTGVALSINGIAIDGGAAADDAFELQGLGIVRNQDQSSAPRAGRYTITVEMTHAGFLGTLTLAVTARIQEALAVNDIVDEEDRNVTVTVATGYSGNGYQIPVDTGVYALSDVSFDPVNTDYDAGSNFIQILPGAAVTADLRLAATATADCADVNRDCAPVRLTVEALFVPLPTFAQSALNEEYSDEFTHAVAIGDYSLTEGANLAIAGVAGGADDGFVLDGTGALTRNTDPAKWPDAGSYTVTLELTHNGNGVDGGFLGVLTLEVEANISRKALADAGVGLPDPAAGVVVVAAGDGAVGREIARAALTGGDANIGASIEKQAAHPDNLSLAFLPEIESQMVVFYMTAALESDGLSGGGELQEVRTTELTITSSNRNYLPLERDLTLTIRSLRNPGFEEVSGEATANNPYTRKDNIYDFNNFKSAIGDYARATNFARDPASSAELLVDANTGIVSTNGPITQAGTYRLIVSVTAPDFVGTARLELRLVLAAEDIFSSSHTIPSDERIQNIYVVPGYSGEVATYAAMTANIVLRTPSAAPAGFTLPVDTDFLSPEGFALLLDAGQIPNAGETAVADFTVTANAAGFVEAAIGLTVTVARLAQPTQEDLPAARDEDGVYGGIVQHARFATGGVNRIVGVAVSVDGGLADLADWDVSLTIEGANLQAPDANDPDRRLAPGRYVITVETTHAGFKGAFRAAVSLTVQETLKPDNVVAARDTTQPVVEGHFGANGDAGYAVPIGSGYTLAYLYDDSIVTVDETNNQIKAADAVTANLTAKVTANVTCVTDAGVADAGRNCAPLQITLSVTFTPVASPTQNLLTANPKPDAGTGYDHPLVAPTGGYAFGDSGAALSIVSVSDTTTGNPLVSDDPLVSIDANYRLIHDNAGLPVGKYVIVVEMTHPGFLGALDLTVMADIQTKVSVDDVAKDRVFNQEVATGYSSDAVGRAISISGGYRLTNLQYDTNEFLVVTVTEEENGAEYAVRLVNQVTAGGENLTAAVAADVICVTKDGAPDAERNCAPLQITLSVTFIPVTAMAQGTLSVGDEDAAAYDHRISVAAGHAAADLQIAGAHDTDNDRAVSDFANRIRIVNGLLQRVGDGGDARLTTGSYEITVEASTSDTQRGFLGTLTLVITARIQNSVNPNSVLADRDLTVRVAAGHPELAILELGGVEYRIPEVSSGYQLENAALVDDTEFNFTPSSFVVRLSNAMPSDRNLEMVMIADVICTGANANCAPRQLTVSVTFVPVTDSGQTLLEAAEDAPAYNHVIGLPAGLTAASMTVEVVDAALSARLTVTVDGAEHKLNPVDGADSAQRLPVGPSQEILLRVTHPDFAGMLTITVTANISGELTADGVVRNRDLEVYVADGWFGDPTSSSGYVIVVEPGHRLINATALSLGPNSVDVASVHKAGNSYEVRLSTQFIHPETNGADPLDTDDTREVAVQAEVECVTPGGQIDSDRNCPALTITVDIDFKVLKNPTQNNVTVSEGDSLYNHPIVLPPELAVDADGASYEISRVTREGVVIQSDTVNTDISNHRVRITPQGFLQPFNLGGLNAVDDDGTWYDVTPVLSHRNLVGKFQNIPAIRVYVGKAVEANAVLAKRNIELNLVEGHFGDAGDVGYRIPFGELANVKLSVDYDGAGNPAFVVVEDSGAYEVRLDAALTASVRALTLTAVASCIPGGDRICVDPTTLTLTVTFKRYANPTFYASIMDEFNSNSGFEVAVSVPDDYSIHSTPGISGRTVSVIGSGDYPLPLEGLVESTEESCLALGGRVVPDSAAQICVDYTFSNSAARTSDGGGCVISGGESGEHGCAAAFEHVRDCNTGAGDGENRPAMNNNACSDSAAGDASICPGGYALGGGCPIVGALIFRETDDMLVYAAGDQIAAPGAGVYTVTVALTHSSLVGRLIAGAVVSITKKDAPGSFGLDDGTSATRRVAPGHTGEVYRTSATGGVITLPATLPSDIYSATGGRELVISLTQALARGDSPTHMFTLTVKYGNVNRAKNHNDKDQVLALLVEALDNPIPTIPPVISDGYNKTNVYDFGGSGYESGDYAGATFVEVDDSPHFVVDNAGVVGTQTELLPGEYAITVAATDDRSGQDGFLGTATLTLSLTVERAGGAGEYVNNPDSIVRVATGHTGGVYTLTSRALLTATGASYTLTNHAFAGATELTFDADTGVFSIPGVEEMGASARRMTVTAQVACPSDNRDSSGSVIDVCEAGGAVAATLTVTLHAVPVSSEDVTANPVYNSNFDRAVPLPWKSTETEFSGGSLPRFGSDDVSVVLAGALPAGSANKFVLTNGAVRFAESPNQPGPGAYTLTFHISDADDDGIVEFVGTVTTEMEINVIPAAGIEGVPDGDLRKFNGSPLNIFVPYRDFISPVVVLTLSDTSISTEFAEPSALPAGSSFSLSLSGDKRTLVARRSTAENAAPLPTTAGQARSFVTVAFTVTAAGDDSGRYVNKVQQIEFSPVELANPEQFYTPSYEVAGSFSGVTVSLATIGIIPPSRDLPLDLDEAGTDLYSIYADLSDLTFGKESGDEEFTLSEEAGKEGVVVVSAIDTVGSYAAVFTANSSLFMGVARFTLSVQVNDSESGILFAGIDVTAAGMVEITDIVEHPRANPEIADSEKNRLVKVSMAYHGKRRGLHWVYGIKYYEEQTQVKNDTPDIGLAGSGNNDWYSKSICEAGNSGGGATKWRLPTLIEAAGAMLGNDKTKLTAKVSGAVGNALSMFEIFGDIGSRVNAGEEVTLSVPSIKTSDATTLTSSEGLGYFIGVFNLSVQNEGKGTQAHVYYDGSKVVVNQARVAGRVACVQEVKNEYEETARWAELSVADDGRNGPIRTSVLTLSETAEAATVNVTVGLGLFTVRSAAAPTPVPSASVIANLSVELRNHQDAFAVNPVTVSGGAALEVSVSNDAASIPNTGIYTLSVILAPTGNYIGFAQRDFTEEGKTSYNSRDETQFDAVRLVVDWTKPPTRTAVSANFNFAGTEIEFYETVATVPGINDRAAGAATSDVDMRYYGDVGGLRVMYSQNAYGVNGESYGPRLCAAGNVSGESSGWRNPTLTELGMLLTGPSVTVLTLTVSGSTYGAPTYPFGHSQAGKERGPSAGFGVGMPGNAGDNTHVLDLTFPKADDDQDGMVKALHSDYSAFSENFFRVKSGLYDNAGEVQGFVLRTTEANMDVYSPGLAVCVQEISGYDATKHNQLAGIRFEAAGNAHGVPADGDIALSVSAITVSGVSFSANAAVFTLTAKAFIFDDVESGVKSPEVIIKDLTTNPALSVGLAGANAASFALATSDGTDSGSDMIVISYGDADPGAKMWWRLRLSRRWARRLF